MKLHTAPVVNGEHEQLQQQQHQHQRKHEHAARQGMLHDCAQHYRQRPRCGRPSPRNCHGEHEQQQQQQQQ
jgi:hypothetical protein